MDFYDTLNINRDASSEDIRNGYLAMSRLHHPDKGQDSNGAAFRDVNRAYRILSDSTLREFYDKHGHAALELIEDDKETMSQLVEQTDKLLFLEKRVRMLLRSSLELQAQRWLQPSVSLTMGSRILQYPNLFCWSHTATTAGLLLGSSGRYSASAYVSSHTQRGGVAVSRASLVLGATYSPTLTLRSGVHVMGGRWPGCDFTLQKQISEATVVRQVLAFDNGATSVSTEWIQQLGEAILGTLGVSLMSGGGRGLSFELAKQRLDYSKYRGKLRFGIMSSGEITLGGKLKYMVSDKLELHVGPSFSSAVGVSFDLAVQTELPPLVEEQEGAFPTLFTWQISVGYPQNLTLGVKVARGGFNFNFPIELPEAETKWALIAALTLWTLTPLVVGLAKKNWSKTHVEPVTDEEHTEGDSERASIQLEAAERKAQEEASHGLVIVNAKYAQDLDVTDVLMARVRKSTLTLSSTSKSTLLGFRYPTSGHDLEITYKYGDMEYHRVFKDSDVVILP